MQIQLKQFQLDSLDAFRQYLESCRITADPAQSFDLTLEKLELPRHPYRTIEGLERVPYVCLRVPTGGGKTIMASHAVRIAGESYIEREFPVVLWLVPTSTIKKQTAEALKKPGHPYRQALDDAFDGRVRIFEADEIDNIRPADLEQNVCVLVATIQTLRVQSTEGRQFYAHKESLEDHFTRLPKAYLQGLEKSEDGANAGRVKYSFANLMALQRPMVIVDEAHNVRTALSFDSLSRVSPSCILELTATPSHDKKSGSNVLYRVSAMELKAEALIKLPVVLCEHRSSWQDAIGAALRTRKRLADIAAGEPDYIRPLLLIQAQDKNQAANVEEVKKYLEETEKISPENIAIATGEQRDLDKVNLFDPTCPIEIIITVEALREGWDCSFAYVFCSTANVANATAVEQLLGRVLRMPYAKRRKAAELNKAYAHLASQSFGDAAKKLVDKLIDMGFEGAEAAENVEVEVSGNLTPFLQFTAPVTLALTSAPELADLSREEQAAVTVTKQPDSTATIEVFGDITPKLKQRILDCVPVAAKAEAEVTLEEYAAAKQREASPAERGVVITLPRLCVEVDGQLQLFDKQSVEELAGFDLGRYPASVQGFTYNDQSKTFVIDVVGQRVTYELAERQLNLEMTPVEWSQVDLVSWLDGKIRQPDVTQPVLQTWINTAVHGLISRQGLKLDFLVNAKFMLARYLKGCLAAARVNALADGYQEMLLTAVVPAEDFSLSFMRDNYAPHWLYDGSYTFKKHLHYCVGELDAQGEEFECARAMDGITEIQAWVRNISKDEQRSFWLQTSTDKFYPDFVALLEDGRTMAIEYKGGYISDTEDTREKRELGELWERRSGGKCLFVMAKKRDAAGRDVVAQICDRIAGR